MRKLVLVVAFALCSYASTFAQATSLTVDCQHPGWLSNSIDFQTQQSLESIKISGYINGTDIKFIRELNQKRNLKKVIDLEDVNVVAGGEAYQYKYPDATPSRPIYSEDNEIGYMFYNLTFRKVILPKSINNPIYGILYCSIVDTVITTGNNLSKVSIGTNSKIRCLYLSEGVTDLFVGWPSISEELFLPSTIGKLGYTGSGAGGTIGSDDLIIHCASTRPDTIRLNNYEIIKGRTIYVPEGTKELYLKSIFRNINIIEEIAVKEIHIIDDIFRIHTKETMKLPIQVLPENALRKDVEWVSMDTSIVQVNSSGIITGKAFGETRVIAYSQDKKISDTCTIIVNDHTTGVAIEQKQLELNIGESKEISANTLPEGTSDNALTWSSNNPEIASVDENGKVTALKRGACIITATAVDGGSKAECTVTVLQPAKTVSLNKHILTVRVGNSEELIASVGPDDTDNKKVVWNSADSTIVKVSENGIITGKKAGKTFIYATAVSNLFAKDSCEVTSLQPVAGIMLNETQVTFESIGKTKPLIAKVLPEDASDKSVRWTSSNPAVCSITENGTIVSLGIGTSVITATTVDGGFVAVCIVTVKSAFYPADVNRDGTVDSADIVAVIKEMPDGDMKADVNNDGAIDSADIVAVIKAMK